MYSNENKLAVFYRVLTLCTVSVCRLRSTFFWNASSQRSLANGLTPACLRIWVIRLLLWLKALLQTRHWCGFSPEGEWVYIINQNMSNATYLCECKYAFSCHSSDGTVCHNTDRERASYLSGSTNALTGWSSVWRPFGICCRRNSELRRFLE